MPAAGDTRKREEGIVWAVTIWEAAKLAMNSAMWEQKVLNRHQQQRSYIRRNATGLAAYARAQHARLGPGLISIEWPSPEFSSLEQIQGGIEYMTEEIWRLGGIQDPEEEPLTEGDLEVGESIIRVLSEYDPSRQAVVMFNDRENIGADVLVPTFIYESSDAESANGRIFAFA